MKHLFLLTTTFFFSLSATQPQWIGMSLTDDPEAYMEYSKLSIAYDFDTDYCKSGGNGRRLQQLRPLSLRNEVLNANIQTLTAAISSHDIDEVQTNPDGTLLSVTFSNEEKLQFTYHNNLQMDTVVSTRKLEDSVEDVIGFAQVLQNLPCVHSVGISPIPEASSDMKTSDIKTPEFIRFVKPNVKPEPTHTHEHEIPTYPNDPLVEHSWWYSTYSKLLQDYPSEADSIINPRIQDVHQIWNGGSTNFKILASDYAYSLHDDVMNRDDTAIWINEGEYGGPWTGGFPPTCSDGIDNDGNGYIDDCGTSMIPSVPFPSHGSMSIGVMTGLTNNNFGVASTCPGCKSALVGFFNPFLSIEYAIAIGAKVLNLPYTYWRDALYTKNPSFAFFVKTFIDNLRHAVVQYEQLTDGLVVTASGNVPIDMNQCTDEHFHTDPPVCKQSPFGWPCSLGTEVTNMVCVGPSDKYGKPWQYATYGRRHVSVFAPGVNLEVIWGESTATRSGSSISAGIVSGIAALVRSRFPDLSARQIKRILIASCKKGDGLEDMCECGGVVDAVNAMAHASVCTADPDNCGQPLDQQIHDAHNYESIMSWFCDLAVKYGPEKVPLCHS